MKMKFGAALMGALLMAMPVMAEDEVIVPVLDQAELMRGGKFQVAANWSALKRGWNDFKLQLTTPCVTPGALSTPIQGATISISYDMIGHSMGAPKRPVVEKGNGFYEKRILPGMSGEWKFDIEVTVGAETDTFSKIIEIK